MRYRVHSNPSHGHRLLGDYPTLDAAHTAASCAHPGSLDECLCGGGSVIAVIETAADRALIAATADGMRYAYVPTDVGVTIPMPFVEAETLADADGGAQGSGSVVPFRPKHGPH
jgi:hypothetical protein